MVGNVASASMPNWGGENTASKSHLMHGLREGGFFPPQSGCLWSALKRYRQVVPARWAFDQLKQRAKPISMEKCVVENSGGVH